MVLCSYFCQGGSQGKEALKAISQKKRFCTPLAYVQPSALALCHAWVTRVPLWCDPAVRDLASMSLDHSVKRCFFLLFPKNRTELKLLLPLDACSLNPVHCASESACNFLLLSGLQEAEHTADRGF